MQLGFRHVVAVERGCDHGAGDGVVGANHALAGGTCGDVNGTCKGQRVHEIRDTAQHRGDCAPGLICAGVASSVHAQATGNHVRWRRMTLQHVLGDNTILSSTSALDRPEKIPVLDIVGRQHLTVCRDNRGLKDLVGAQTKLAGERTVTSSLEISPKSNTVVTATNHDTVELVGKAVEHAPGVSTAGDNCAFRTVAVGKGPLGMVFDVAEGVRPDTQSICAARPARKSASHSQQKSNHVPSVIIVSSPLNHNTNIPLRRPRNSDSNLMLSPRLDDVRR